METETLIRVLRPEEIEVRVATISERGLTLLLYKDARVDQKILDETFGSFYWKRCHTSIDGVLYCTVSVFNKESGEWVSKQDVGTSGFTEKEKSQASDSFKRACVNWGVGRELYSAPFIFIPASKCNIQQRGDKYVCFDRFKVESIGYSDDREITSLTISNGEGQVVYEYKCTMDKSVGSKVTKEQKKKLSLELERTGVSIDTVKDRYNLSGIDDISPDTYEKIMSALTKTKSAKAA